MPLDCDLQITDFRFLVSWHYKNCITDLFQVKIKPLYMFTAGWMHCGMFLGMWFRAGIWFTDSWTLCAPLHYLKISMELSLSNEAVTQTLYHSMDCRSAASFFMTPQETNNHSYLIVIPGAVWLTGIFILLKYRGQGQGQSVFI